MKTATKERPILFSGPMVRAILDGRKTQTRRVIKPQPPEGHDCILEYPHGKPMACYRSFPDGGSASTGLCECPCGVPGDRLWVRETWATMVCYDYLPPSNLTINSDPWYYRATDREEDCDDLGKWRFPTHMPRFVSRITLEITGVRVQRLQSASDEEAQAEGFENWVGLCAYWITKLKPGPNADPWVWVIEFKRL